jgi:hypothetical protein
MIDGRDACERQRSHHPTEIQGGWGLTISSGGNDPTDLRKFLNRLHPFKIPHHFPMNEPWGINYIHSRPQEVHSLSVTRELTLSHPFINT